METIGVIYFEPWYVLEDESIRKNLIYFDKLVYRIGSVEILEKFCLALGTKGKESFTRRMKEIEELQKAGLLVEYSEDQYLLDMKLCKDENLFKVLELRSKAYDLSSEFKAQIENKPIDYAIAIFLTTFRDFGQLDSRANSIVLNNRHEQQFVPIMKGQYLKLSDDIMSSNMPVLSVLFKKFPSIDASTDLQRFVDFKNDPSTRLKLMRLREWALDIGKKQLSEKEIEQKYEYLLQEYTQQMNLYKLKYEVSTVETFVVTGLEILENLAKLNFSKAAKILFAIGRQELNLLEAEQKFTGRELAIIHDINSTNSL